MANTLIAYFSWGGSCRALAENLQRSLKDADLFQIETERNYSKNFVVCCVQAAKEKKMDARPALTGYPSSVENYDRVILIYPCWCGTSPMPVLTFAEHIDGHGLRIYPVCSSSASGGKKSFVDINNVMPASTVADGVSVPGKTTASEGAVHQILDRLGEAK